MSFMETLKGWFGKAKETAGEAMDKVEDIAEDIGRRLTRLSRVQEVDTNASSRHFSRDKASEYVVTIDREVVKLPLKEFELLEMFLRNPGRVLTRVQLIDRVWGSDYVGDTKTLDVHVKRLRAKLEPSPSEPELLITVRGLGYKLDA